jgi:hydroxyethylthiazole kinase-like uncharacterized protein yjeF
MVTIAAQGSADVYRSGDPGLIVTEAPLPALLADPRRRVWVCGPGLGTEAARAALPLLVAAGRLVLADAGALTAFAAEPDGLLGCTVLTPHDGEFARVFGAIGPDRIGAARAAAARTGAVVLLKGPDTVVAAPDGRVSVNLSAPPWLATAGAGDVLAGIIGALLGAGMPAWEAASAGAYLHGKAAQAAGPGLLAEDLLAHLAKAAHDTIIHAISPRPRL